MLWPLGWERIEGWKGTHLSLRGTYSAGTRGSPRPLHWGFQALMGQAWAREGLSTRPRPVSSTVAEPTASSTPARLGQRGRGHMMATQSLRGLYASAAAGLPSSCPPGQGATADLLSEAQPGKLGEVAGA